MKILRLIIPIFPLLILSTILIILIISPRFTTTSFATSLKEPFLVLITGMITLASGYLTAIIQSKLQREQIKMKNVKERTKVYRDYINQLLSICQQYDILVNRYPELNDALPEDQRLNIKSSEQIKKIILEMPPAWGLSAIPDKNTRKAVDQAIDSALALLYSIYKGTDLDYNTVRSAYITALDALDRFEHHI